MSDKIYAVIDTNVLVSALFSLNGTSNPSQVVKYVIDGTIVPIYNDKIIAEYIEVLTRDKFPFKFNDIEYILKIFTKYGLSINEVTTTNENFPDTDDIIFYEVALSKEDSYLVTGNTKHFPKKSFVVTPAEMVHIIENMKIPHILSEPTVRYGSFYKENT